MSRPSTKTREISPRAFSLWVKTKLWQRDMTVGELAARVKRHRSTVSTAIHNADRFPVVRQKIWEALT